MEEFYEGNITSELTCSKGKVYATIREQQVALYTTQNDVALDSSFSVRRTLPGINVDC